MTDSDDIDQKTLIEITSIVLGVEENGHYVIYDKAKAFDKVIDILTLRNVKILDIRNKSENQDV